MLTYEMKFFGVKVSYSVFIVFGNVIPVDFSIFVNIYLTFDAYSLLARV